MFLSCPKCGEPISSEALNAQARVMIRQSFTAGWLKVCKRIMDAIPPDATDPAADEFLKEVLEFVEAIRGISGESIH